MIADPMHTQEKLTAFTPEPDFEELPPITGERRGETYVHTDGSIRVVLPRDREFSYAQANIDADKDT